MTEKRKPKGDIKYKLELNEEQKRVKAGVYDKDVTIILGKQGSGKSQTAVLIALDLLFKREVDKIIISRPIIRDRLGYLPGKIADKLEPWVLPLKQCLYDAYNPVLIEGLFADKVIQILPVDFMKGITFSNAAVIVDEFEDLTTEEFVLTLTRLGVGSKLIYSGSKEQVDYSVGSKSCIDSVLKLKTSNLVNFHILETNHRHPVIFEILKEIEYEST